jgi:hypothetical protein
MPAFGEYTKQCQDSFIPNGTVMNAAGVQATQKTTTIITQ